MKKFLIFDWLCSSVLSSLSSLDLVSAWNWTLFRGRRDTALLQQPKVLSLLSGLQPSLGLMS